MKGEHKTLKISLAGLWLCAILLISLFALSTANGIPWLFICVLILTVFQLAMWLCVVFYGLPWSKDNPVAILVDGSKS